MLAWHNRALSCYAYTHLAGMLLVRFRKIGSLIGLLAILMTALAPTISQALMVQNRVDALLSSYCTASNSGGTSEDHASRSLHAHLHACGYCNLVSHTPVLPSHETPFALASRVIAHRTATRFESLRHASPQLSAEPRAPPITR